MCSGRTLMFLLLWRAQELWKSCSVGRGSAQIRLELGDLGPNLAQSGQIWQTIGNFRPNSADVCQSLFDFYPTVAQLRPKSTCFVDVGQSLVSIHQDSANIVPSKLGGSSCPCDGVSVAAASCPTSKESMASSSIGRLTEPREVWHLVFWRDSVHVSRGCVVAEASFPCFSQSSQGGRSGCEAKFKHELQEPRRTKTRC